MVVLGVATLALLVAVVSMLVAWRAVDRANDARDIALAGPGAGTPGARTPGPVPTGTPGNVPDAVPTDGSAPVDPTATGEPPPLTERTTYKVKYDKQSLTLTAQCSYSMYVDLDEPRANVPSEGHDLQFNMGCSGNASQFALGEGVEGSVSVGPGVTPNECADKIRTAPLGDATVPARKGTLVCLMTSFAAAHERGDMRRMVILEITGVADSGATTIQISAWDIIDP